jgi:hypothetical protein
MEKPKSYWTMCHKIGQAVAAHFKDITDSVAGLINSSHNSVNPPLNPADLLAVDDV